MQSLCSKTSLGLTSLKVSAIPPIFIPPTNLSIRLGETDYIPHSSAHSRPPHEMSITEECADTHSEITLNVTDI